MIFGETGGLRGQEIPQLVPEIAPWSGDEGSEWFHGCSLACAFGWTVAAGSALAPQGDNRYEAEKLDDGEFTTAWVEGVPGLGIGEWIEFRLDAEARGTGTGAVPFWGVALVNGYAKTETAWRRNGRVKALDVLVRGAPVARLRLADSREAQFFSLKDVEVRPGDLVRFVIREVYPGSDHEDVAITELILHGAH
jgi:hypothetical protein